MILIIPHGNNLWAFFFPLNIKIILSHLISPYSSIHLNDLHVKEKIK